MEQLQLSVYAGNGRIGKQVMRLLSADPTVRIDRMVGSRNAQNVARLIGSDTVHGRFPTKVLGDNLLQIGEQQVPCFYVRDPDLVDWSGCDVVIDCSGAFKSIELSHPFFDGGATRVLIPAPASGPVDGTFVYGVNHQLLMPDMRVVSPGSCTTGCVAPAVQILHEAFGVSWLQFETVHAVTDNQNLLDGDHKKDARRGRAAMQNIVPTTTGAQHALQEIFTHLRGKIHGGSTRVPVLDGSLVVMTVELENDSISVSDVLKALEVGATRLSGVLAVSGEDLVSSDIIGRPESCIVDAQLISKIRSKMFKLYLWYDNERGFANRLCDLAKLMARQLR